MDQNLIYIISFLAGSYLIGAIPFGLILAKLFTNKDLRNEGSGNIGATNAARVLGKFFGAVTLILDVAKGYLVLFFASNFLLQLGIDNFLLIKALIAALLVIGHIFPIYLKFKGGKGVATALGVIFALNYAVGLVMLVSWIILFLLSRISAISSIFSILTATIYANFINLPQYEGGIYIFLAILIIIRHKENILRMISGNENKL